MNETSTVINIIEQYFSLFSVIIAFGTLVLFLFQNRRLKKYDSARLFMEMTQEFRSDLFRDSRIYVKNEFKKKIDSDPKLYKKGINGLDEDDKKHVMKISHYLDNLGFLENKGLVKFDLIYDFLGDSICMYWKMLEPFILEDRERRKQLAYQSNFERLSCKITAFKFNLISSGRWSKNRTSKY
nr:hypothetical protein [uncultured Draconibacterium sp.]